jgi:hypothetical protein
MTTLTSLILFALIATVVSLGLGISSMVRGGDYDRAHSTRFMFLRVGSQGLAFVLLLGALVLAGV